MTTMSRTMLPRKSRCLTPSLTPSGLRTGERRWRRRGAEVPLLLQPWYAQAPCLRWPPPPRPSFPRARASVAASYDPALPNLHIELLTEGLCTAGEDTCA